MTAVEWLVNEIKESLKDGDIDFLFYKLKKELIEQAKEMEKQQVFDAYDIAYMNGYYDNGISKEQYYNETFKNN